MFDLHQFSLANRSRCESEVGFNHKLESWSMSDWMTAILGELGEAANIVKKLNRVRDGIPGNKESETELREKLSSELADTFIYLDLFAQRAGVNLSRAIAIAFNRKSRDIGYPRILLRNASSGDITWDPTVAEEAKSESEKKPQVFIRNEEATEPWAHCGELRDREATKRAIGDFVLCEIESGTPTDEPLGIAVKVRQMTRAEVAALPDL